VDSPLKAVLDVLGGFVFRDRPSWNSSKRARSRALRVRAGVEAIAGEPEQVRLVRVSKRPAPLNGTAFRLVDVRTG